MRVFKYEIPQVDDAKVRLPIGAQVLTVGQQFDKLFLWALVDPGEKRTKRRTFRVAETDDEIADATELKFIGSVNLSGGLRVVHIFERTPEL